MGKKKAGYQGEKAGNYQLLFQAFPSAHRTRPGTSGR